MTADTPTRRGPPRSAAAFDAQAIADRVAERQAAAPPPPPAPRGPLHHDDGPVRTGTGSDITHVPLPVHHEPTDLFDRLAEAEQRRMIRSPFGDHSPAPGPPRQDADIFRDPVDDLNKFTAPDPMINLQKELEQMERTDPEVAAAATAYDTMVEQIVAKAHDARCGKLLTGGGAPRGWVLVRVIGGGPPRRYCTRSGAATAILDDGVNEVKPGTTPSKTRGPYKTKPRPWRDEAIRQYADGRTPPMIAATLGVSSKNVRDELDRAGVQRRDDRARGASEQLARPPMSDAARSAKSLAGLAHEKTVDYNARDVRAWCAKNGIRCPARGRYLPKDVLAAYRVAHPARAAS